MCLPRPHLSGTLLHCAHPAELCTSRRVMGMLCFLLHGSSAQAVAATLQHAPGTQLAPHTPPCKRAYKRAVLRAQTSPYQGTFYVPNPGPSRAQASKPTPRTEPHCERLRIASYNIGGLSQDAYAELMLYLAAQDEHTRPQIVLLQETHWKTPSHYTTDMWHVVSTPAQPAASGGVAILVSSSLCSACCSTTCFPCLGSPSASSPHT